MGTCTSCEAAVATLKASADGMTKLVLPDGELEEFASPVKASYVLRRDPSCFLCRSDDMEFEGFVSAVGADEELLPGQLYFALPLRSLRHRLSPAELAALAAKASEALRRKGYAGFVADDREVAWSDVSAVSYGRVNSIRSRKRETDRGMSRVYKCMIWTDDVNKRWQPWNLLK